MVKGGSFKPGRGSASTPGTTQGRNGPSDKGTGTTSKPHPNVGTNRSPGTGTEGQTQWKPGSC